VQAAIEADLPQALKAHDWWAESLHFFESGEGDGHLYGDTKIFLIGYSTEDGGYQEVDPKEDCLMAYRDTCFILERLAEWSRRHGVAWQISCVGEPVGTIMAGQWDDQLREYVDGMKRSFPWSPALDERAAAISAKYASRW
jgi:hypothetical protein